MGESEIVGSKLIGLMTKDELIDELLAHQRAEFEEQNITDLKAMVVNSRMEGYRNRLLAEAGLKTVPGFMGIPRAVEEGEED